MANLKSSIKSRFLSTYKRYVSIFITLLFFNSIFYAQCPDIQIVDLRGVPGYAQFDEMSVCGEADTLALIIYTGDPGSILGFELELDLPAGLEYSGWEFTDFQGTSISNSDPDLNNPVFIVDGFDGDSLIVVNIGILADCEVDISQALMLNYEYSYNFLDENNVMYKCDATRMLENELNSAVKTPVLNVLSGLSPAELTISSVGSEFCQTVSISQDGISSYLDEYTFEILGLEFGTDLVLNSITANGTENVPFSFDAATNSTTATISGDMFIGNNLANPADQEFNTNEIMEFEVCYQINACPTSSDLPFNYNAYYGCNDQQCQISGQSSFLRIRPTGSQPPTATTTLINGPTVCGSSGEIALSITNPNISTDQNKYTDLNIGFETCEPANLGIEKVEINGTELPPESYGWVGDDLNVDFSVLPAGFDPDGAGVGLMDLDGDGVYDDLEGSQTVSLSIFLEVLCGVSEVAPSVDICPANNCGFAQFYVGLNTNCGNSIRSYPTGITGFDIINGATAVSNDERDIPDGAVPPIAQGYDFGQFGDIGTLASPNPQSSSETVIFCYDFASTNFNSCANPQVFLQINFTGQEGYIYDIDMTSAELSIDGGTTYTQTANLATDTTWTNLDTDSRILQLNLGSQDANVCYRYTLEMDSIWCPPPAYWFGAQQVIERCTDASCGPEGCNLLRACRTATFYGDAESNDCPCILTGDVREIYRKNYGYTDESMETQLTRDQVDVDDQNRYLPCDTMMIDYWWVVTDQASLDLPNLSRIDLALWQRGPSNARASINEATLAWNPSTLEILELAVQKVGQTYEEKSVVDFSEIEGCADNGLNLYGAKHPWGNIGRFTCSGSTDDIYDGKMIRLIMYNYDKIVNEGCLDPASYSGNCLDDFIDETGYLAGDTIRIKIQVEMMKNPTRAVKEALGIPLPPASTNHLIVNSSFIDFLAEGTGDCYNRLGSDCGVDVPFFGTCPGTISSLSNVTLDNCGGNVTHTFYMNPEIPIDWFDQEFRPIYDILAIDDPFFTPMAYCGNGEVTNYVGGVATNTIPVSPLETDNMFCVPVEGYSEDLCAVESSPSGTLFWNLKEAGSRALGLGNVAMDSISFNYDFCLICPEALSSLDYQMVYDYGLICQNVPDPCHYKCWNAGSETLCADQGFDNGDEYYLNVVGDSSYVYYDNIGPNVTINDTRTPVQNVTADLGTGAATLISSSNPGVSEELQAIEICNPDPVQTAEGVAATVTLPSSVILSGVYSDAGGSIVLNSTLVSDNGIHKIYQIDLNVSSIPAGDPCQIIYVGTTLLFCPEVGEVPPNICIGAISGCSPVEVRAALSAADGCGGNEVCYAYVFGEVGLQTEWFDMPANPGLCEPMTFNVLVKNVKELTLLDLVASFDLPTGLTVDMTSWEVAYPGGPTTLGNWMPVPAPDQVVGNTYTYTDDNIWSVPAGTPVHNTGLEGVSAANATADNNKVSFRFTATTNCDEFLSGSKMYTETTANDPCAEGTTSSGVVESPGVVIDGADPADNAQLLVIAQPKELNCMASVNTFGITALNTSDYSTADSVITCITIPEGLTYVSNSIIVTQPSGYTIVGLDETPIGNTLEICFQSPPVGVSQAMKLQFDAMVDEGMECGNVRMDVDIKSVVTNQSCATGPNCDVFVQNSINPSVTVQIRPPFMAEEWNVYSECGNASEISLYYEFTIDHNGPDAVNQVYTANFYQDVDGDGFINANVDNLVSTTNGTFSVNDGRSITVSGNSLVANADACPLMMELVYATSCSCDREELKLDNLGLKFLAPYADPISMCPGDCLEIEVCDFVEVIADSIIGATGIEYIPGIDYGRAETYSIPHDSTQTPIKKGPPADFLDYNWMTDNQVANASGVGALLINEQSTNEDGFLIATYPFPVNVERMYLGAGRVSGWTFVNGLRVYGSRITQLEYSIDGGITWINSGLVENHPNNNEEIFEYVLPTPITAQHWRLSSTNIQNWGTSEFRFEGASLPFEDSAPVTRNGNMVTVCVPEGVGIESPWRVDFVTGVGSCENIETLVINNIGDVEITLGPEIVACGTDCVDLEVELLGEGTLENTTVSWSPQTGLSDPTSLETEACVSADQTYIATVTFPGGCVKTASVSIDHQNNPPLEVDGADIECFNTKDHPILIAPAGFDVYMWFEILNGIEIPLGSTTVNTYEIMEAGGEYFVKGISSGLDCPGKSPSYQITDKLLPQVCLPVNVNVNR